MSDHTQLLCFYLWIFDGLRLITCYCLFFPFKNNSNFLLELIHRLLKRWLFGGKLAINHKVSTKLNFIQKPDVNASGHYQNTLNKLDFGGACVRSLV